MTSFPGAIFTPRTKQNKEGVSYDPDQPTKLFAEDIVYIDDEVVAMQENLQDKIFRGVSIVFGDITIPPQEGPQNLEFIVPGLLEGYKLVSAHAGLALPNDSGNLTIGLQTLGGTRNPLGTDITIEAGEKTSYSATTQPVVDDEDYIYSAGDDFRIIVSGNVIEATGLQVFLTFKKVLT